MNEPANQTVQAASSNSAAPKLPVRAVTLFSAGVAYLLREGQMPSGAQEASLTFRTTQINDILKSLVLLDDGGTVQAATYPSRDPVGRTLESFAIQVTHNTSRADLLGQVRGALVSIALVNGETLSGRVLGVEQHEETLGDSDRTVITETLVLLGDEGIVSASLQTVRALRLLDARLDNELREALMALASGSDDARRTVTLRFAGEAARTVRVGYLVEAPLWKVSYRLVLEDSDSGDAEASKPYLQGWAMVENTTDEDWDGVQLSLVSGRPVSFVQDLYQPLYVPRPVVPPDVIASPYPQTHGGDLSKEESSRGGVGGGGAFGEAYEGASFDDSTYPGAAPVMAASMPMAMPSPAPGRMMAKARRDEMRQSAPAQAEAKSVGELFQYDVSAPVDLPRQQAALIPIVSGDVHGEKLSLFNAGRDARFPMNAVQVKNTTDLHLKGGPVTLFDGGIYAGEARMEDLPPGDKRLLTYAVDLAVECEMQTGSAARWESGASIVRGVLNVTYKQTREAVYTIKNKAKTKRAVWVEHPFSPDWKLVAPVGEPAERTAEFYRFAVAALPGETQTLTVAEEQPYGQTVALLSTDLHTISYYVDGDDKANRAPALRKALQEVIARRAQIDALESDAQLRENERDTLTEEQGRIRENMAVLDKGAALYRRYTNELDQQENRLNELRKEVSKLRLEADKKLRELRVYLDGLTV